MQQRSGKPLSSSPTSILDYFPSHLTPRPEQANFLLQVEKNWDLYQVIVGTLPTAVGKTEVLLTIARWQAAKGIACNLLEPTNVLVEQFAARYPEVAVLNRRDSYRCEDQQTSCAKVEHGCKGCVYYAAKRTATKAKVRLMNYHTYWAHKLYAPVALFDEGHQVVEMLADKKDVKLWRAQWKYPSNLRTVADLIMWIQAEQEKEPSPRLAAVLRDIIRVKDGATVIYREATLRGKPDTLLSVIPRPGRSVPTWLWPSDKVQKMVFLSATISAQDMKELGLANRRTLYLECASPIPVSQRPVVYAPTYNMGYNYQHIALPQLAKKITELLAQHPDKGLVHLPYGLAAKLQELSSDPRLVFHDSYNKAAMLEMFKNSPPSEGRVLVASGLYEGVDLPYDAARWQVIGKVPFLSLADERVKAKAKEDQDWYDFETIKKLLQACGRIVRAQDDYGITYIFDSTFAGLWNKDKRRKTPLFPKYFRDAIKGV